MSQFLSTLGRKKGDWTCPPAWKLDFTCPLIRIDYTSPPQSCQAALRISGTILTAEMFKKTWIILTISFT